MYLLNRPEESQECSSEEACESGMWFVSVWGSCSAKECGSEDGSRSRKVMCMKDGSQTDPGECPGDAMPEEVEDCQAECEDEGSGSGSGSGEASGQSETLDDGKLPNCC